MLMMDESFTNETNIDSKPEETEGGPAVLTALLPLLHKACDWVGDQFEDNTNSAASDLTEQP